MKYASVAMLALVLFCTSSCESISDNTYGALKSLITGELSDGNIALGLKEALLKGTEQAVSTLSQDGGYSKSMIYRLAVPEDLQKVAKGLRQVGLGSQVDYFEAKMNEAAEEAAVRAKPVFVSAIKEMTLEDVKKILMGSDTAATEYFRNKTYQSLKADYLPIVTAKMEEIGAVADYNSLMKQYNAIPFTPKVDFNVENYVTDKALKGLFGMLENTEKEIRKNPAARTTELLRRVFAEQDSKG